jgi:4-hydroxyphenylpyruvate dioxygenase
LKVGSQVYVPTVATKFLLIPDDLLSTLDPLRRAGVPFAPAPRATDHAMVDERLPGRGEPVSELRTRILLLDGATHGENRRLLLQILSQSVFGPVFFEIIQPKGHACFGKTTSRRCPNDGRDRVRRGGRPRHMGPSIADRCANTNPNP